MTNELYHFGIKGMKWGVRRNRDKKYASKGFKDKKDYEDYKEDKKLLGRREANKVRQQLKKGKSPMEVYSKAGLKKAGKIMGYSAAAYLALLYTANPKALPNAIKKISKVIDRKLYNVTVSDSNGKVVSRYRNKNVLRDAVKRLG